MATFDFPADLLDLQRRFDVLDARCGEVAAALPSAADVVAGVAEPTGAQREELARVRAERLDVAERLQTHPWWETVNRLEAKAALRVTART